MAPTVAGRDRAMAPCSRLWPRGIAGLACFSIPCERSTSLGFASLASSEISPTASSGLPHEA
jgi:hypothetical protein